ncbi:DUF924 family protein [Roseibaca sp. V10]|uniref:DUF924 family protein n=1 Tax=Roseinatronobacter domitianus TaxID=2940293 RepID=A0ABT0M3V5_9RHOB|nr:DUF924 family protein [Roseibaca domitiana]MCL1629538.1 DUF924 family protein [Roseibaca domitiana]
MIWFQSGRALDAFCQPFAPVVRELKSDPPSLTGEEWNSLEGKAAKVLLADQLSRSCFRGCAEAFSYDPIARRAGDTQPRSHHRMARKTGHDQGRQWPRIHQ